MAKLRAVALAVAKAVACQARMEGQGEPFRDEDSMAWLLARCGSRLTVVASAIADLNAKKLEGESLGHAGLAATYSSAA